MSTVLQQHLQLKITLSQTLQLSPDHLFLCSSSLLPSAFFFLPPFLINCVFPGQGVRTSYNAASCICTSWIKQGKLSKQGSF